jgi:leucyl aminopeptidase
MNWTQEKYKVANMIELSTLTGAVKIALGARYAGMFGNDKQFNNDLKKAGEESHE